MTFDRQAGRLGTKQKVIIINLISLTLPNQTISMIHMLLVQCEVEYANVNFGFLFFVQWNWRPNKRTYVQMVLRANGRVQETKSISKLKPRCWSSAQVLKWKETFGFWQLKSFPNGRKAFAS